ncbi:hypothetical protein J8273_2645 [Carpediemonas membranifera]|uniref:Uncharacterized protein n=1 Tax=Carpediemonas membranifera TaxID=201153 RepID=A0A8J6E3C1_9EUKA|nr:hypothetical protein J8273_2645 [Carpediemonas membranifera]|eukprot:KAG9395738.1 hypothetical protein J8273_2645 [Carpediemonas membranifera]
MSDMQQRVNKIQKKLEGYHAVCAPMTILDSHSWPDPGPDVDSRPKAAPLAPIKHFQYADKSRIPVLVPRSSPAPQPTVTDLYPPSEEVARGPVGIKVDRTIRTTQANATDDKDLRPTMLGKDAVAAASQIDFTFKPEADTSSSLASQMPTVLPGLGAAATTITFGAAGVSLESIAPSAIPLPSLAPAASPAPPPPMASAPHPQWREWPPRHPLLLA